MILVCDSEYAILVGVVNQFNEVHARRGRVKPYLDGCVVTPIISIKLDSKIMTRLEFCVAAESCISCDILERSRDVEVVNFYIRL